MIIELTAARTRQLCDAMTVSKDLMANLLLAAGGRSGISTGGGGSNGELTNWDGTKKRLVGEYLDCPNIVIAPKCKFCILERHITSEY